MYLFFALGGRARNNLIVVCLHRISRKNVFNRCVLYVNHFCAAAKVGTVPWFLGTQSFSLPYNKNPNFSLVFFSPSHIFAFNSITLMPQIFAHGHVGFICLTYFNQSCKKIIDLDLKDRDHFIDLNLLGDLDPHWWSLLFELDLDLPYWWSCLFDLDLWSFISNIEDQLFITHGDTIQHICYQRWLDDSPFAGEKSVYWVAA